MVVPLGSPSLQDMATLHRMAMLQRKGAMMAELHEQIRYVTWRGRRRHNTIHTPDTGRLGSV
jgi:hypothetical protein